jgi:hypothetical protein
LLESIDNLFRSFRQDAASCNSVDNLITQEYKK